MSMKLARRHKGVAAGAAVEAAADAVVLAADGAAAADVAIDVKRQDSASRCGHNRIDYHGCGFAALKSRDFEQIQDRFLDLQYKLK